MKKSLIIIGVLALSFIFYWSNAYSYSNRSYDAYTLPVMYLDEGIDETQTDNITLAAPKLNGSTITVRSMSGAIFEFKRPGKKEDIYFSRVAVNADNTVSLTGSVIRDLCQYTETGSFTTCGNGIEFGRGTEVRLSDNHRIFNLKMNIDRLNVVRGSGGILCGSSSQPCMFPGTYTTAQKNAFTNTHGNSFHILFDETIGVAQYFNPTAGGYYNFGSGSTINATTLAAGKIEVATVTDILNHILLGDSGAPLALTIDSVTRTSTGSTQANKIVATGTDGRISGSLLGVGTKSDASFLMGSGWTIVKRGSGVNLNGNVAYSAANHQISGTTFRRVGTGAITVTGSNLKVGDLLTVKMSALVGTTAGSSITIKCDFLVGNGRLGNEFGGTTGANNGLAGHFFPSANQDINFTMDYTFVTKTGGTLPISPVCKTDGGDLRFNSTNKPTYLQLIQVTR
jgi:hypothetical protein